MTQTQPEALRLADCLDLYVTGDEFQWDIENSAAELRRLHAENESQVARIAQLEAALAGAEPVSGQCRFAGEKSWGWCAVEHVRMVQADPRYAAEGYEARYLYTHPPASRQPQSDEQIDALPIVIHLRQRIKHWKRESVKQYVEGWNDSAEQEAARSAPAAPVELPEPAVIALTTRESSTRGTVEFTWGDGALTEAGEHNLYTEQQVRELLSQAGTVLPETPESPPKSAETRMDASSDRGGGVLPEWLPIESAPKDGSEILLLSRKGRIANGCWMTANDKVGAWMWPYVLQEPTHWAPLPQPPKEQG